MQFSTLFIAAVLPFFISASPTERRSNAPTTPNNKLQVREILPRAGEDAGCSFNGRIGNAYINHPAGDKEVCFGWDTGAAITCGGPYEKKELDDIKKAVKNQVKKDGWLESSDAGEWTATFQTFTTAFESRDTAAFDEIVDAVNVKGNSGAGQLTYYWQRKGDYLTVQRSACPGSILEKK
ncbi:MAG: hypothetical protein LQ348_001940 [Seirophora lacunosa]|nr:MAG: hypothetical protein LQ348_001940 [Seirophora lacunosa]